MKAGRVYLVGAGPGDPGLMTQKGLECLAKADVVVYDHLLDERLLESASDRAEKIYAGKSGSKHAMEQDEINRLLVKKASEGKVVVRLKGGDPFVFGRGGEEAQSLFENGVTFDVVPGVSSAVAVPAYAGIPVTHRGVASSFSVVTGHEDPGKAGSSINWEKLATCTDTLVFLMGMQNLPEIVAKLVAHGLPEDTPVAVVKEGTRPEQKTVTGTLANIAEEVAVAGLGAPAVIVVGGVVALREKLRWFDNRPLSGKRVLVTRSRQQASVLSRLLAERGAQPLELPAIDIRPVSDTSAIDGALSDLGRYHWIVFTSVNGVEAFFTRLHAGGRDSRSLSGIKIAAIGPATAGALRREGVISDWHPEVFTGAAVVAGLKEMGVRGQRFLLPRTDIADRELAEGIAALGGEVAEITVYRTVSVASAAGLRDLLATGRVDIITFASSSTVSNLMKALEGGSSALAGAKIACIGPKTAEAASKAGLHVDIMASQHTIPGLVEAMEEYYRGL